MNAKAASLFGALRPDGTSAWSILPLLIVESQSAPGFQPGADGFGLSLFGVAGVLFDAEVGIPLRECP